MNTIIKILLIVLISAPALLYTGCACSCNAANNNIPAGVVQKANDIIIAKTGKDFFNEYFSRNLNQSKQIDNGFHMVYQMAIPGKPYVNESIEFTIDTAGAIKGKTIGIPDCINGDCSYSVSEKQAIEIAENNGLDKGIKNWSPSFDWNENYNKYVWNIRSVKSESPNSQGGKSSGTQITIDANTGEVLEKNDWYVR